MKIVFKKDGVPQKEVWCDDKSAPATLAYEPFKDPGGAIALKNQTEQVIEIAGTLVPPQGFFPQAAIAEVMGIPADKLKSSKLTLSDLHKKLADWLEKKLPTVGQWHAVPQITKTKYPQGVPANLKAFPQISLRVMHNVAHGDTVYVGFDDDTHVAYVAATAAPAGSKAILVKALTPSEKIADKIAKKAHIFQKEQHDWYVEDQWVSVRLFEEEDFECETILDPFCGMGRILEGAEIAGCCHHLVGHDIVDRGGFTTMPQVTFHVHDSMSAPIWHGVPEQAPCVVTNPPYDKVNALFQMMLDGKFDQKCALFLPMQYLSGKAKYLSKLPLSHVWVCTPRPNCLPGTLIQQGVKAGGGLKDFGWFVFDPIMYELEGIPPELKYLFKDKTKQVSYEKEKKSLADLSAYTDAEAEVDQGILNTVLGGKHELSAPYTVLNETMEQALSVSVVEKLAKKFAKNKPTPKGIKELMAEAENVKEQVDGIAGVVTGHFIANDPNIEQVPKPGYVGTPEDVNWPSAQEQDNAYHAQHLAAAVDHMANDGGEMHKAVAVAKNALNAMGYTVVKSDEKFTDTAKKVVMDAGYAIVKQDLKVDWAKSTLAEAGYDLFTPGQLASQYTKKGIVGLMSSAEAVFSPIPTEKKYQMKLLVGMTFNSDILSEAETDDIVEMLAEGVGPHIDKEITKQVEKAKQSLAAPHHLLQPSGKWKHSGPNIQQMPKSAEAQTVIQGVHKQLGQKFGKWVDDQLVKAVQEVPNGYADEEKTAVPKKPSAFAATIGETPSDASAGSKYDPSQSLTPSGLGGALTPAEHYAIQKAGKLIYEGKPHQAGMDIMLVATTEERGKFLYDKADKYASHLLTKYGLFDSKSYYTVADEGDGDSVAVPTDKTWSGKTLNPGETVKYDKSLMYGNSYYELIKDAQGNIVSTAFIDAKYLKKNPDGTLSLPPGKPKPKVLVTNQYVAGKKVGSTVPEVKLTATGGTAFYPVKGKKKFHAFGEQYELPLTPESLALILLEHQNPVHAKGTSLAIQYIPTFVDKNTGVTKAGGKHFSSVTLDKTYWGGPFLKIDLIMPSKRATALMGGYLPGSLKLFLCETVGDSAYELCALNKAQIAGHLPGKHTIVTMTSVPNAKPKGDKEISQKVSIDATGTTTIEQIIDAGLAAKLAIKPKALGHMIPHGVLKDKLLAFGDDYKMPLTPEDMCGVVGALQKQMTVTAMYPRLQYVSAKTNETVSWAVAVKDVDYVSKTFDVYIGNKAAKQMLDEGWVAHSMKLIVGEPGNKHSPIELGHVHAMQADVPEKGMATLLLVPGNTAGNKPVKNEPSTAHEKTGYDALTEKGKLKYLAQLILLHEDHLRFVTKKGDIVPCHVNGGVTVPSDSQPLPVTQLATTIENGKELSEWMFSMIEGNEITLGYMHSSGKAWKPLAKCKVFAYGHNGKEHLFTVEVTESLLG